MQRLLMLAVSLLTVSGPAQAQDPEQSWGNLRALGVGERIEVVDQRLKSQNGTFLSVSDEAITFQVEQNEVLVQRADVLRVSLREGMSRATHTMLGLAIGAGAALAVAYNPLWERAENEGGSLTSRPVFIAGWAGIGAGIGALLPSGHRTVYRAERWQGQGAP